MAEILSTKLFIPRPRKSLVSRPRLIERLNAGQDKKLILIAAPAGFGKTTLLSEWIPSSPHCVTWQSLDEGDHASSRFWTYFIAALQTLSPDLGKDAQALLNSIQPPATESILNVLINEINAFGDPFFHVLDDYHLVESADVDRELAYLIDHQPANLHLIITTREIPHLPLARLRARDQFTELRAGDLRFTASEAAEFLQAMSLNLSADDMHALEDRTEGWIAGLQLAALSMQGRQDVPEFIRAFAGSHRYIVDYLIEEVLQSQSDCVRSFLIQTSILDQLNGPLCEAVSGQAECDVLLETLEQGNYFVIPLDDRRHWYRYHHLFGDVLRMRLMAEQPDLLPVLHRRASAWYEQNGSGAEAIRHALAGQDFERAATLIERVFPAMSRSRQEATLLGWLKTLPETVVRRRPVLCNQYAGSLMQTGELEGVETWLLAAEEYMPPALAGHIRPEIHPPAVAEDPEELRRLPGAIAIHRAGQALMLGNVAATIQHARQVLDLAPQDDFLRRGGAAALQGLAFWTLGELEAARRIYPEAIGYLQRAGYLSDSIGCALALADIVIAQGHLHAAMGIYEQALRLASEHGQPKLRGTADMLVGMSELYYEHNDLHSAAHCLQRAVEQGELSGLPQNRYRLRVAMAHIRQAEGDPREALGLLDEAERLFMRDFSPNVRPIPAIKARIHTRRGRLDDALDWAREQGISPEDDLSYLREFEHITLARMLLAGNNGDRSESSLHAASSLLERLLKAAEEGGRMGIAIEILVLQALVYQALGQPSVARLPLERALALAEPEGYIRIFLDEGPPMRELLQEAAARKIVPAYTGKLLAAYGGEVLGSVAESLSPLPQSQIEPLSQRELDVLRLFQTELSGPEIARELIVALSTVRTHTKSIYSKLDVNSRRAAVKRAAELGLI